MTKRETEQWSVQRPSNNTRYHLLGSRSTSTGKQIVISGQLGLPYESKMGPGRRSISLCVPEVNSKPYRQYADVVPVVVSEKKEPEQGGVGLSNLFTYSNLVHAVSGATGSVVAISVFYPLDTVRTRLQVDDQRRAKNTFQVLKDIFTEEGLEGLYRGWFPVVTAICCSNFVYFYSYNGIKSSLLGKRKKTSPLVDLCVGFAAGILNVLITTPLWVANTRLKLQGAKLYTEHYQQGGSSLPGDSVRYNGIIDCLRKILETEGVKKLWSGTVPSLLLASNPAIQFMVYEALKRYFRRTLKVEELSGLMYFLIGAIAKAVATVVTYPLQVVQSRLRAGYAKLETSQTLLENLIHLVRTRGFGSLYKGMESKLLQTVLTAALMFFTYEKISSTIFHLMSAGKGKA